MCLEIWCIETYSSVWISVRLNEAITALQKILAHRVELEEYEDCQEIVDLISAVEVLAVEKASSGPQDLKKPAN
jgi:protein-arginine kinase activator protein McsA